MRLKPIDLQLPDIRLMTKIGEGGMSEVWKAMDLANNRVAHFSNAGLGEQWYALMLEEPKVRQQRPRMQWR